MAVALAVLSAPPRPLRESAPRLHLPCAIREGVPVTEDQLKRLFGTIPLTDFILWLIAAIALLVLVVKLWPSIKKFVATVDALSDLPAKLELLDEIHHEVRPNTGTSLNDAIRRVEVRQIAQDQVLGEHTRMISEQGEKVDGLQKLMEDADAELAERDDELAGRLGHLENTLNPKENQ